MKSKNDKVLIAYVPVPHAGYLKLFRTYPGVELYILGREFIKEFTPLVRNLPGVKPEEAAEMIRVLGVSPAVRVLTPALLNEIRECNIIMPDEDVAHAFVRKYFGVGTSVTFDDRWKLRWDWGVTQKKKRPEGECVVKLDEQDQELMAIAVSMSKRSPDWWRQIGAVLATKEGNFLLASFNRHVPSEQSAYCYGDPRSNFEPGEYIELSTAVHAEAGLIAEAAKRGISTQDRYLWVTTFPCPPCAYLCAFSGLKRIYYVDGYARIDGDKVLQEKGVEIFRVET